MKTTFGCLAVAIGNDIAEEEFGCAKLDAESTQTFDLVL
jgi:hypothetical protein